MSVRDFYDELARDYYLVYEDWNAEVERQGSALDRLIRAFHKNPVDVLDCSCGIGTQAIGLARHMYTVHFLVLTEGQAGWTVAHYSSRYRAVGRATITQAAEDIGFTHVT